ncbi:unnamed protein product, partial [Mycena citricolor]
TGLQGMGSAGAWRDGAALARENAPSVRARSGESIASCLCVCRSAGR